MKMSTIFFAGVFLASSGSVDGFARIQSLQHRRFELPQLANSKGFGKVEPPKEKKKKADKFPSEGAIVSPTEQTLVQRANEDDASSEQRGNA